MTIGKVHFRAIRSCASMVLVMALAIGFAATAAAQPGGCPPGMTGYWKFNETSGGPYDDFFGSNNATCTNCPATVVGKLGNGLDFDGTNDRVDIPDDNSFDWTLTTSFTIEFWMRSSNCVCSTAVGGYTCNQVIVGRAAAGWWIGVNCEVGNVGKLRCYFTNADFYSNTFVGDNVWHHVVYQYDNAAGQYRLYIDGSLDKSVSAIGANRIGSGPVQLGYYATAYQYGGLLDEFALYNQALSLGDIQSHYNSGSGQVYCAGNQAPIVTDIPGETIAEGGTFATISLDNHVSDADHTDAEMTWTYSGNTELTVSIVNRVATITTPSAEWSGSETITFTATDPLSAFDSDDATFTVTAVNDPPIVTDIPGETIAEGGTFATISLDNLVSDADHTDAEMTWTYSGNSQLIVSIVNRVATITTPSAEWSGSETITFTATDPLTAFDSDDATFTVTAVNDPPIVTDIPGETIAEGGTFATISLDDYVSDADHADALIIWTYSGNSQLTVSIVNRVATITTPSAEWSGSETITFTATDPLSAFDSDDAAFTVTAVNDPPIVTDIPGETITEGGSFATVSLDNFVSDADHTDAQMTWTYSGNSQLIVSIVNRVATITTPNAEWSGSETITFTATDPLSAFDSDDAAFTITAVNDPPIVTDIPGQSIAEGGSFGTINLDDYVSDADHADAQIIWTYSGNSQLIVSIVNRVATITTPNTEWSGSETITFTATDPLTAFDSDDATFTVTAVNDAPIVTDIPDETITEGGTFATINLDNYVSDADHADALIIWTYSGNSQLTVSIVNRVATITTPSAEWSGSETITFTATDPLSAFDSDDAAFTVTAVNDPPIVTEIPGQSIAEGGSFGTINLDDYVSDADHADALIIWTYSGNTDLIVSIDGNRVATIATPGSTWTGSETITFTATDPEFASGADVATFSALSQGCPDGMLHYWQLDDTSTPPLVDSYGNTDATCTDCPTPVTGLVGGAQEFDRLTDLVTVPDDGSFDWTVTSSYTIEFWLNKSTGCDGSTQPDNEVVIGRASGGWWIGVMCEAGLNRTKVRAYFGATTDLYSTTSVTDGEWHHVAFVRDNTAGEWRMYIDGDLEVTQVSSGRNAAASDPLSIGWFNGPDAGKYRLGAVLDELALYNSALSGIEIANHYNLGLSGLGYCQLGVPPTFTSTPDTAALGNRGYVYDAEATGSPDPVFQLTASPAGMTIDSLTGLINWTPTATGTYPVSISAINVAGTATQAYTIVVSALAPLITSTPITSAIGGVPYEYDVDASADPAATYFVFGTPPFSLPSGMTFNSTSGLISWPNPQPGSYPVSVQAVNVYGTDLQSYVLVVTPVAPLIISSPPIVARTGSLYHYQVLSSGSPSPFFYLDIAPSGMLIDSVSGEITWLPTAAASYPVKIRAVNSAGDDAQVYVLAVSEGITNCSSTMLHYWRLNELAGPSYANFITPLTAQCVGACPTAVSGNVDGGQKFGGGNVGLQVADNGSFDWLGTDDLAIEFWMRRDLTPAIDSNEVIIGRWGPQWWVGINHDGSASDIGKLRCCMSGVNLLSNSTVNDDFWHHVVASRSAGVVSLYLDGELQSSAPSTITLVADDPLTLGYLNTGSPILGYLRYKGILDEVALHGDDLPLTVITAHYNDGLGNRYCARCGDCDANGNLTISDVVSLIGYIFSGGPAPEPLLTGDSDCSNMVTISDVVYMINFIFSGGPVPCANCK